MKQFTELDMNKPDPLDEIIQSLTPDQVPPEFILMAKVRTYDGMEKIIQGQYLEGLLEELADNVAEVRVLLDVKRIRSAVISEANHVFAVAHAL